MSSDNLEKYKNCFAESLEINLNVVNDNLEYNSIPEWDSIGHMTLMSSLEEKFDISIETDDVIDFSSFKKGQEILSSKYFSTKCVFHKIISHAHCFIYLQFFSILHSKLNVHDIALYTFKVMFCNSNLYITILYDCSRNNSNS